MEVEDMTVNSNFGAMGVANRIGNSTNQAGKASGNIASGSRINRAAADAAGLAIAMKLGSQVGGTGQAVRNVYDGISLLQTAEGALGGTQEMLGRINELSVQASSGTLNDEQRGFIQMEIDQLKSEIDRVAGSTNFNGINLLDGSRSNANGGLTFQIGANGSEEQRFDVSIESMNSRALGLAALDVRTMNGASDAISMAEKAGTMVSEQRASLGAAQNRLEHTANSLITSSENLTAAQSRIADADMAIEMIALAKNNILQQASVAMLAHKINEPQGMLALLNSGGAFNVKA